MISRLDYKLQFSLCVRVVSKQPYDETVTSLCFHPFFSTVSVETLLYCHCILLQLGMISTEILKTATCFSFS